MTCLVTTLKDAVTDTEMPKLDELVITALGPVGDRFSILPDLGPVQIVCYDGTFKIGETGAPTSAITISGNSVFLIYPLTPNSHIRLRGLKSISRFNLSTISKEKRFVIENPEQISRASQLRYFYDSNGIADPTKHAYHGDLRWLINPEIRAISMEGAGYGDLSTISAPECTDLQVRGSNFFETPRKISGKISGTNFPKLINLSLKNCTGPVTIDLSSFSQLSFVSMVNTMNGATWTANASTEAPIVALEKVNLGDYVVAMLNDQAKRNLSPDANANWLKTINVTGAYDGTSAATAIATLKSKGVKVVLNGVEY